MSRVKQKEALFYTMLKDFSDDIAKASADYTAFIGGYPDSAGMVTKMKEHETNCDSHVRKILTELDRSFITPFDREDISRLTHIMDTIADGMEDTSACFQIYNIEEVRPEAVQMAQITNRAVQTLNEIFQHFAYFKKEHDQIMEACINIGAIEDEGDVVYRSGLYDIFHGDNDPLYVLKWSGLFAKMEHTIDACHDVATVIKGVVLKNG